MGWLGKIKSMMSMTGKVANPLTLMTQQLQRLLTYLVELDILKIGEILKLEYPSY